MLNSGSGYKSIEIGTVVQESISGTPSSVGKE